MKNEEIRGIESPSIAQREKDERRREIRASDTRANPGDGVVQQRHLSRRLKVRTDVASDFARGHRHECHGKERDVITGVKSMPKNVIYNNVEGHTLGYPAFMLS